MTQLFFKGINDTDYYLLTKNNRVTKYKGALGAYIVCIILGIMAEMAKFMKWYIVVRNRVTHNSLGVIIKEDLQNPKERVKDYGLDLNEKFTVIILFVVNRTIQIIMAV